MVKGLRADLGQVAPGPRRPAGSAFPREHGHGLPLETPCDGCMSSAELFTWCLLDPQRTPSLETEPGAPTLGTRERRGSQPCAQCPTTSTACDGFTAGPGNPVFEKLIVFHPCWLRENRFPGLDWDASNPRTATERFLQGAPGGFSRQTLPRQCKPTSTIPTEPLPRARRGAGHSAAREGTPALSTSHRTCGLAADGHHHPQASEVTGRSRELAFLVLFPLSLFSTF